MTWTTPLLAILATTFVGLSLVKVAGWIRRRQGIARLPADQVTRAADAVDLKVLLFRTRAFHGMQPGRAHLARADLRLSPDRFVLASDRGVLADLSPGKGRRFRSVRCTGPGRLVIEGDVPNATGPTGLYRFELVLADASQWAVALAPFVDVTEDSARYASFPVAD